MCSAYCTRQNGTHWWYHIRNIKVIKYPQYFTVEMGAFNGTTCYMLIQNSTEIKTLTKLWIRSFNYFCDYNYRPPWREQTINTEIDLAGKSLAFFSPTICFTTAIYQWKLRRNKENTLCLHSPEMHRQLSKLNTHTHTLVYSLKIKWVWKPPHNGDNHKCLFFFFYWWEHTPLFFFFFLEPKSN